MNDRLSSISLHRAKKCSSLAGDVNAPLIASDCDRILPTKRVGGLLCFKKERECVTDCVSRQTATEFFLQKGFVGYSVFKEGERERGRKGEREMADLFNRQAKQYAEARPSYPAELFQFLASKTPEHELAWDVGTGNGQAAVSLAGIYKNVVGTDTSAGQLSFADKLPNIRYQQTAPAMTVDELRANVAPHQTIDIVTVAQAFHWFDRPTFYQQVKWLLKKPNGVLAVWCYTLPRIDDPIDAVLDRVYAESKPFWAPPRKMVDDEYRSFEFPFEPVEGTDHTGPFEFEAKQSMDLDAYLTYLRSWSAYQTAQQKGFDLLREEVLEDFKRAWGGEDEKHNIKEAKFPVFLRIGKVGNE